MELLKLENVSFFENPEIAHLMAVSNRILSARTVNGLDFNAEETDDGIFEVMHKKGLQRIKMDVTLEEGSRASFIAHCVFPDPEDVKHIMDATISVYEGAEMNYKEIHFHGPKSGIFVNPKAVVSVEGILR